ncbi:ABC transporter substrate-binding protein [Nocardioides sp. zg-ZUI104]|uniref:ABC transporter substrate-binding protein n=1 Tax=Nocardioides faecalis TaxID=2803858 RepID=UPI001BD0E6E9|nr:ABC transporter substrate-binding protein [Nocardioides faecalis]MBS4751944.1 ABC transporter substrate-binding protein [Nocardioides faecalis]
MRPVALATALVACLAFAACGEDDGGAAPDRNKDLTGEPIVIGLDEDSTGPGASYSTIAGKTIRNAVERLNAEDGILGRPVELVIENDESDPTKAPSVIRKLLDQKANALILVTASAAVNQAKPVIQKAGIPAIAPIAISQTFAEPPDSDYAYSLANVLSDFVKVYCGAAESEGYKTLAILSDDTPTIEGVNGLLKPGLEECFEIVADEVAPEDTADVNAQVAKIQKAKPDAILVSSVGGNFEVLAHNTLAQQLPDTQRFSLASIGNQPDIWKLANPAALKGLVFMGSIDHENPKTADLEKTLRERRGEDDYSVTAYDAQAWDAVMLLKQAIEAAGSTDGAAIQKALNEISGYEASFGQTGFTLTFAPDKHLGADGLCGLVLTEFGDDNKPSGAWGAYQPPC